MRFLEVKWFDREYIFPIRDKEKKIVQGLNHQYKLFWILFGLAQTFYTFYFKQVNSDFVFNNPGTLIRYVIIRVDSPLLTKFALRTKIKSSTDMKIAWIFIKTSVDDS